MRSLVKRSTDTEPQPEDEAFDEEALDEDEARRGQVSFSITANFQALQQKLMRELWSRSPSRVMSNIEQRDPFSLYLTRTWWPDPEY